MMLKALLIVTISSVLGRSLQGGMCGDTCAADVNCAGSATCSSCVFAENSEKFPPSKNGCGSSCNNMYDCGGPVCGACNAGECVKPGTCQQAIQKPKEKKLGSCGDACSSSSDCSAGACGGCDFGFCALAKETVTAKPNIKEKEGAVKEELGPATCYDPCQTDADCVGSTCSSCNLQMLQCILPSQGEGAHQGEVGVKLETMKEPIKEKKLGSCGDSCSSSSDCSAGACGACDFGFCALAKDKEPIKEKKLGSCGDSCSSSSDCSAGACGGCDFGFCALAKDKEPNKEKLASVTLA